ncbi:MAG: carboxypeptidase regulatory-like domain-containing protein [Draconibacterium sp.]
MKQILFLTAIFLFSAAAWAQPVQTIRGRVTDKESKTPLPGANVVLVDSNPLVGASTDSEGNFRLEKVPLGRQSVQISFMGYKPAAVQSIIVNSAKEVVIEAELEENVIEGAEIVVRGTSKDEARNQMALVSARSFTVEETEKYAGSRGDVARMAMNFAGVSAANDQRNDIIIRGNSPSGLLWRLEDVDIPNPNHFAEGGTTGGPVGMLNNNVLENSDFFTGAFPSEYGNALSGVFDLNMRNGNNQQYEHLFQVGFNGFELGSEGPLSKNHKASYLANFRYSTMQLMDGIIDFGTSGIPEYKDLSFKLNFPLKKGRITLFGLGGDSRIAMLDSKDGTGQDLYSDEGQDLVNRSKMAASGLSFTHFADEQTWFKITLSGVYQEGGTTIDTLDENNVPSPNIDHNYAESKVSVSGFVHRKFSSRFSGRAGLVVDRMGFDLYTEIYNREADFMRPEIDYNKNLGDGVTLFQPYVQGVYKFSERLSMAPGIHFSYFGLNGATSVEPRLAFNWQMTMKQKLNLGYGLHSKTQSLSTYFLGTPMPDGTLAETNTELDMTKSHQLVLGYENALTQNTRLKAEAYYQHIFNVPVETAPTSFSMLNTGAGWGVPAEDSLQNTGTGVNYGLEFTLERFFSKNIYYLATLSLFESKYKGSDGIERNTAFNGNYVANLLFGKEFTLNSKSSINVDLKATFAGGKRYTPIDLNASQAVGEAKYIEDEAYSLQFDPFVKADFKIGYRLNGKKVAQEWIFYVENFTNHENVLMQSYSPSKNEITNINQLGFFPMLQYRLNF